MRNRECNCCDICGEEIRVIGDTELLDGHICQDCASLLSPWFTEDLDCTEVEEIQAQLDGRDANLEAIPDFHPSRHFGYGWKIIVDDQAKTFVVAETRDLWEENPDIIRIEDVSYCTVTPEEDRAEIGDRLYRYRYQFLVEIGVAEPDYIDEISFYLNEEPLEYESSEKSFMGFGGFDPEGQPDYDELAALAEKIENVLNDDDDGTDDSRYQVGRNEYNTQPSEEEEIQLEEDGSFAPGKVMVCPWCGSKTMVDESFRCKHCGGNL